MSELKLWKCDWCGEVFTNKGSEQQFKFNYQIEIKIDSHDIIASEKNKHYMDICKKCYGEFEQFLDYIGAEL